MEKPGPEHDLFRQWVVEQDIKVNGISPAKFVGRGIGIVAERNIEADEELVFVPTSALLSTDSIVDEVKDAALGAGISVHGLLAMYLAVTGRQGESSAESEDPYASWRRVWPSRASLATMPLLWPYALRGLRKRPRDDGTSAGGGGGTWSPLPPSVNGEWSAGAIGDMRLAGLATSGSRLERMRRKADKDWTRAKALCEGNVAYEDYLYHWLIVNTRSFFFDETADRFDDRDDKMALCPFIDYFNHADAGCRVAFNEDGYYVTADRAYARGEELCVSYGDHDNDLLLTDYGFILERNAADAVPLDDLVLYGPGGVYKWKALLSKHEYYGEYKVGVDGPCYRTQMAAAVRVLEEADWVKLAGGLRELSPDEKRKVDDIVEKWLETWLSETERAIKAWDTDAMHQKDVPDEIRHVALGRWKQIQDLIKAALRKT